MSARTDRRRQRRFAALCVVLIALAAFLMVPRTLAPLLHGIRPDIVFAIPGRGKEIFLTIDDAPSPYTPEILRILEKHHVSATFFVIGDRVASPAQLREIIARGHSLGNHLKTTQACSTLSLQQFKADFESCDRIIGPATHGYFRPPSDFGTKEQIAYAASKGRTAIIGTVFPLDHWISNSGLLAPLIRWLAVPGGVIILHDGGERGRTTAALLDDIIPILKDSGYVFAKLN